MKKKSIASLMCGVVITLSGCQTVPGFGEITPLMWDTVEMDPIGLVLSGVEDRSGSNSNPYPDVDLTKISKMPVYKATGKADDQRADGKAIAEKFGIDYNYLKSIWSDTEDVFTADEYYSENMRYGLWWHNDEGKMCGAAGTRVVFLSCDNATEADILAAHHGLTDTITAAYIVQTDWNELYQTTHSVEITVAEYSESFEKVGEYDIIPFEEAERRFKNNENVNYTREIPEDESDENKEVFLKYITDSEGYVRTVYVYGISPNDSSVWIDAIKR